jgi:hypothetical protein
MIYILEYPIVMDVKFRFGLFTRPSRLTKEKQPCLRQAILNPAFSHAFSGKPVNA